MLGNSHQGSDVNEQSYIANIAYISGALDVIPGMPLIASNSRAITRDPQRSMFSTCP